MWHYFRFLLLSGLLFGGLTSCAVVESDPRGKFWDFSKCTDRTEGAAYCQARARNKAMW